MLNNTFFYQNPGSGDLGKGDFILFVITIHKFRLWGKIDNSPRVTKMKIFKFQSLKAKQKSCGFNFFYVIF